MTLHDAVAACLRRLPAETAHNIALWGLSRGLGPRATMSPDPILATRAFGRDFANPIGLAAGFDKNARAAYQLFGMGFGFVEIGGVTPKPQAGNPKPRLFRLPADAAVINRMGFNNDGAATVSARLGTDPPGIVGVNLAANADSDDPAADFETLAAIFAPVTAFLTLDISCPNTANGRVFLSPKPLADLLTRVRACLPAAAPALLIKLAPDLEPGQLEPILDTAMAANVDGVIVCNTTVSRPDGLQSTAVRERGGLSGQPLFAPSTELLKRTYAYTRGTVPLIGVGGVASAEQAYAKIRAGASLVQLYTALVYHGPSIIGRIQHGLADLLRRDGFKSVGDAVGADQ